MPCTTRVSYFPHRHNPSQDPDSSAFINSDMISFKLQTYYVDHGSLAQIIYSFFTFDCLIKDNYISKFFKNRLIVLHCSKHSGANSHSIIQSSGHCPVWTFRKERAV
jgi:hypothetical protein